MSEESAKALLERVQLQHGNRLNPDYLRGVEEALRVVAGEISVAMFESHYLTHPSNLKSREKKK